MTFPNPNPPRTAPTESVRVHQPDLLADRARHIRERRDLPVAATADVRPKRRLVLEVFEWLAWVAASFIAIGFSVAIVALVRGVV